MYGSRTNERRNTMKYKVTCWAEVAIDVIVDAEDEAEATDKAENALSACSYVGDMVGVESEDDDVEVDCVDLCDDFRADYCEVAE